MDTKYKISIEKLEPYEVLTQRYEAADGVRYSSEYSIPEGVEHKKVDIKTGAIDYHKSDVFMQEVEELKLPEIIKAINNLK